MPFEMTLLNYYNGRMLCSSPLGCISNLLFLLKRMYFDAAAAPHGGWMLLGRFPAKLNPGTTTAPGDEKNTARFRNPRHTYEIELSRLWVFVVYVFMDSSGPWLAKEKTDSFRDTGTWSGLGEPTTYSALLRCAVPGHQ